MIVGFENNSVETVSLLEKIKNILSKIPLIYYLIIFIVITLIYFYTNSSLKPNQNISNNNNDNKDDTNVIFKNDLVRLKYNDLRVILGEPTLIENNKNYYTESVTWKLDLDTENFKYGKYNGLDYIRLNGYVARKYHPIPAPVFVVVGKYINVPENLYGPLKYASPTINIEQIYIPQKHNLHYEKTGEKKVSLVTGSCASITISAITLKFVEDMIKEYKHNMNISMDLHKKFRSEYDLRVMTYLCGKGITPKISWFSADNFDEQEIYNSGSDKCSIFKKEKNTPSLVNDADKVSKIIRSIDNSITTNELTKEDIANLLSDKTKTIGGKKCDSYETANNCNDDNDCIWDNGCEQKFCNEATDKDTCESDEVYASKCYWDNMDENNKCKHRPS